MASTEHLIKITLRLQDEMSKEIDKSASSLKSLGANLTSLGTQMTAAFTVPIVAAGVAGLKLASDLDKSMYNIQSITNQTDGEISQLSDTLVNMSMDMTKTVDSVQHLSDAMYEIDSSGYEGAASLKLLEDATKAASAGLTDTTTAANGIITVLQSYKLGVEESTHVSDVLFETVKLGRGSFEQLSASLGNVIPTASIMNVKLEEVAAAMSTLTKNGATFADASVQVNAVLKSFITPSKEMSKAITAMGYSSGQAMIDALGFAGAMQKVQEYTGGSSEALSALFPDIRSFRGAAILAGKGAESFASDLEGMMNSTGATQAAFDIQMKSFDATWKNFQNTLNAALIDIGQTMMPVLTSIMNALTPLIKGFMALPEPVKQVIIVVLALLAALGPLLIIIGQIMGAISAISVAWPILVGGFTAFAAGIAVLLTPLGIFLAVVALVAAAIIGNWFGVRDAIVGSVSAIVQALSVVGDAFKSVGSMIMQGWGNIGQHLSETISQLIAIAMAATGKLFEVFFGIGQNIVNGIIKGIAVKIVEFIAMVEKMANDAATAVRNAFGIHSPSKVMEGIGKNVVAGFHKGIEGMGGIGVSVQTGGNRSQSSLSYAGASAGGGGAGITQNFYITSQGTSDEQIKHITKEVSKNIGKDAKRRGAKNL